MYVVVFFQAEDGIRDLVRSRGLGDVYKRQVLVREIQQHITRGDLVHIDFMEVDMKSKLRASAELVTVGTAMPEADGLGVASLMLREVEIECLPDDLVAEIEIDLSAIKTVDDTIYVRDIICLLYTSPSPRDRTRSRMPSSA